MYSLTLLTVAALSTAAAPPDAWTLLSARVTQQPRPEEKSAREQLYEVGLRESKHWAGLKSKEDWEKYRNPRIAALRKSLGIFPEVPKDLKVKVRKTIAGEGYAIDCLTFESRPGLLVTANLYRPAKVGKNMPGISIVHSHHNPKTEGELQDMGVMWAKAGCYVLVADQLGHGERRQHPFVTAKDYPGSFRPSRQDYFFRYNLAIQLQTIGDSLMGWMVWDIMRGIDLLLSRPGIDPKKIVLLGSVAGGGDPCAVAGALDERISCVGPFNFGGPQPETRFPLPEDAEASFLYTGSGSWESTRNLAYSARDGFLPWAIVGGVAPRKLIYAHEFAWNADRDPVWKRLQTIHEWYGDKGGVVGVHGAGSVRDSSSKSTHCNNIGAVHRKGIHVALKKWFGIEAKEPEKRERRSASELWCLEKGESAGTVHEIAGKIADERMAAARRRAKMTAKERAEAMRQEWRGILALRDLKGVKPGKAHPVPCSIQGVEAFWLEQETTLLLLPKVRKKPVSLSVFFGQGVERALLKDDVGSNENLIRGGTAVALVDLGGLSGQPVGPGRGRGTGATSLASSNLMLGKPILGMEVERVLLAMAALRARPEIDPKRIELWAMGLSEPNAADSAKLRPLDASQPQLAEPRGAAIGLLCALFDEKIDFVFTVGGLVSYRSLLASPFVHVPYDAIVAALTTGDLSDVVAVLVPRYVALAEPRDGLNRKVSGQEVAKEYERAIESYLEAKAKDKFEFGK